jgi:putative transposase
VLFAKLRPWPVDRPRDWTAEVNSAMDEDIIKAVQLSIARGVPLGDSDWQKRMAGRLGLEATLRPRGRPRREHRKSSWYLCFFPFSYISRISWFTSY